MKLLKPLDYACLALLFAEGGAMVGFFGLGAALVFLTGLMAIAALARPR